MEGDANDLECRVCRNGPEDGRPLYFPCLCSGSIGAVHQDCLEAWLDHSKKDTCELCLTKYRFEPHYADGMPDSVSAYLMAKSVLKMLVVQVLPFALRIAIALVLWVLIVPVLTTCIYSICVGRSTLVPVEMSWNAVRAHIVHGFNIDAVIAMSLLILVCAIPHHTPHRAPHYTLWNMSYDFISYCIVVLCVCRFPSRTSYGFTWCPCPLTVQHPSYPTECLWTPQHLHQP